MTDAEMKALAAWYRREVKDTPLCRCDIYERAEDLGIEIDMNDCIKLFHCINDREDDLCLTP